MSPALALLRDRRFVALTGAGISTDSGIPDYRGPGSPARTPMTDQEFVSGPAARQRYWARSHIGWSRMRQAQPNAAHHALARLEAAGALQHLVTQNVDGLHEAAGSRRLCALHGRIADVVCLSCGQQTSRALLHDQLRDLNPGFAEAHAAADVRPDGDVELSSTEGFVVPGCGFCGGVLKPDVVFFGENVPRDRVRRCFDAVECTDALLVLGSSLAVMSGLRFVRRAHQLGVPVVIVNRGETRGDPLATYKVDVGCADFLAALCRDRGLSGDVAAHGQDHAEQRQRHGVPQQHDATRPPLEVVEEGVAG
jgi:NAD-dependent SIR2 family protein deacetylase